MQIIFGIRLVLLVVVSFICLHTTAQCIRTSKKIYGTPIDVYTKDSQDYYWNVANLPNISTSAFPIEIRLYAHGLTEGSCYTISCDGKSFLALVSEWDTGNRTIMRSVSDTIKLERIFLGLIKNNVFSLPDEQKLKFNKTVRDGIHYMIEYKYYGLCGRYQFSNPKIYYRYYPEIPMLRNYVNIADLLQSLDKLN